MPRAAAIDIGTNTVLCAIAERRGASIAPLAERARITRLGAGVDRTRELSAEACARTLQCLRGYRELCDAHGVTRPDVVGTSALRDARSGERFLDDTARVLGVRPRVLSGPEEAELTFRGALSGLELRGQVLVFDVGGGSTEIVLGSAGETFTIFRASSLDVGSVRLFERHVRSDPPREEELSRVRSDVRELLGALPRPGAEFELVGVAGTVTTLACMHAGLEVDRAPEAHGRRLGLSAVESLAEELARAPLASRLGMAGLDAGRADVIPVGAALVSELVAWAGADSLIVSDRGVRWGLLERALAI